MSGKASVTHDLYKQTEAARVLLAQFQDILGDDAQARADMVEGETSLHEAITRSIARIIEIEAMEAALGAIVDNAKARIARLGMQKENLRTSLVVALELAEIRKLETPLATVSLKAVPQKVEIVEESQIPARFWKPQEPKLDKRAVLEALKAKEEVPGATLSNGGASLQLTAR